MVLELGDQSKIRNEANDIHADVEFKTKGYFTGTYNAISGKVVKAGKTVGELHGKWNETMEYKHSKTGETEVLFDATKAKTAQKTVRPETEQEDYESEKYVQASRLFPYIVLFVDLSFSPPFYFPFCSCVTDYGQR